MKHPAKPAAKRRKTTPPASSPQEGELAVLAVQAPEQGEEGPERDFAIVGIGASAGGLEAFTHLLQALPANTGFAFVFIQHLDPKHGTLLPNLLQQQTSLPVCHVADGTRVEPDHIYIIPPNTSMTIQDRVLALTPRSPGRGPHMAVDTFFLSLARDQKSRSVGVVLSGTGFDGSAGIEAIKGQGGITFAQDSSSAKYDSMPRSAEATGCVDFVLSPEAIAQELAVLGQHPYVHAREPGTNLSQAFPDGADSLSRILGLIRAQVGIDFTHYKESTIKRRVLRRMALKRSESVNRYLVVLRSDPSEVQSLYEDILINVTEFFRDPEVFEALKESVFPQLLAKLDTSPIRIWVSGCSRGEEVYSIAISVIEFLEDRGSNRTLQIFGTDISETSLRKARQGIYGHEIAAQVSPERLRRFFMKGENGFQVLKSIRDVCIFAKQNVVNDPPFSRLDLISCRNVLIYLGPVLQRRVVSIFHYALKPSGYLLLGSSETIGSYQEYFNPVDKKNKIFTPRSGPARLPDNLGVLSAVLDRTAPIRHAESWTDNEALREADRIALAKYGPPGVVIDDDLNIIQFRGHTSEFLEPAAGAASLNLLKMAREGLSIEFRNAIHKARKENVTVRREGLRVRQAKELREFTLEVTPFRKMPERERLYLVSFEPPVEAKKSKPGTPKGAKTSVPALERENAQLRQDLVSAHDYLQSVSEEKEAANEELRSANEEIQSSNEELQSTNEELETAKEELQSTNEELNTVNEELQTRNLQLIQAGNDLMNLLSNVNMPIVMLGNDLRIRRFTPVSERVLNLIPADVGQPISRIKFNIEGANIQELLLDVVENLSPKTVEVRDANHRRYSLRIRPYRTEDNKIDGVVMLLVDLDTGRPALDSFPEELPGPEFGRGQSSLRVFTQRLLSAQEEERRRISRELHDEMNQMLAVLELDLTALEKNPPSAGKMAEALGGLRGRLSELSDSLRGIAYQLHPSMLDDLGLAVALESFCKDFSQREGIHVTCEQDQIPFTLDRNVALHVYRIAQEALRNVARHSGASEARVTLRLLKANLLSLEVVDTGIGFDRDEVRGHGGLGLTSMEERAVAAGASLALRSSIGEGTRLRLDVPLQPQ